MSKNKFSFKEFRKSFDKVLKDDEDLPISKTYKFLGEHVHITFFDPLMNNPINNPSHIQYFEVKIKDIDPNMIRSFKLPEFNYEGGINVVEVTMFLYEGFDESKYDDIMVV
jgi:hypothetical protein